jgi:hypothetical protein
MISRLLYEPQLLQTRCGIIKDEHLLQLTNVGGFIFQLARRLSRRLLDDLFLGHIGMGLPPLFVIL